MATYIIIHNPSRGNTAERQENPAQEIVDNIRAGKRATTAFGGWDVTMKMDSIEPGDRLLFYRSYEKPTGFFAVGRVLRADDCECRKLRVKMLREWYPGKPESAYWLSDAIGPAAYEALRWDTGEGTSHHINAEWEVVGDPKKGQVLFPCDINKVLGVKGPKRNGQPISDECADAICKECRNSPHRCPE